MLWHKDIRFPDFYTAPTQRVSLNYSKHALKSLNDDRYGAIPKFDTIPLSRFETIEVETQGGMVTKYVMRGHYDSTRDIIFVLIPYMQPDTMFVKTCWFNLRSDKHKTLDRSKYVN